MKTWIWLAKSRVSITVWKTWKGSRHYTPSHTPSWTVWRMYALIKKGYFLVLIFYVLFYKRNRNPFPPVFPYVIETLVQVWENMKLRGNTRGSLGEHEIAWKHSPYGLVFPLQFLVLPNLHSCFYNCIRKHGKCFLFLKECSFI